MEKYINDYGKECYRGATLDTPFDPALFHEVVRDAPPGFQGEEEDEQYALHTDLGSLTVVDRMTGFGWRDIETGYRDREGKFWLASGGEDVRLSGCKTLGEAIEWTKQRANTCKGY